MWSLTAAMGWPWPYGSSRHGCSWPTPQPRSQTPRSPLRAGTLARTTSTAGWSPINLPPRGLHLGHQASIGGTGTYCDPAHPAPHGDRGRQDDLVQSQARRRAVPRREPRATRGGRSSTAGGRGPSPAPVAASGSRRGRLRFPPTRSLQGHGLAEGANALLPPPRRVGESQPPAAVALLRPRGAPATVHQWGRVVDHLSGHGRRSRADWDPGTISALTLHRAYRAGLC
jgi:hypothetical protein